MRERSLGFHIKGSATGAADETWFMIGDHRSIKAIVDMANGLRSTIVLDGTVVGTAVRTDTIGALWLRPGDKKLQGMFMYFVVINGAASWKRCKDGFQRPLVRRV